jgi:DNA-binding NarL/FixJ family response regulator
VRFRNLVLANAKESRHFCDYLFMSARLTDRQREVLQLVAEGLTDRQIGQRLCMSQRTASDHVQAVLAALGAVSRANAVYLYYVAGHPHNRQWPAGESPSQADKWNRAID